MQSGHWTLAFIAACLKFCTVLKHYHLCFLFIYSSVWLLPICPARTCQEKRDLVSLIHCCGLRQYLALKCQWIKCLQAPNFLIQSLNNCQSKLCKTHILPSYSLFKTRVFQSLHTAREHSPNFSAWYLRLFAIQILSVSQACSLSSPSSSWVTCPRCHDVSCLWDNNRLDLEYSPKSHVLKA
jgi:hypothetical protein